MLSKQLPPEYTPLNRPDQDYANLRQSLRQKKLAQRLTLTAMQRLAFDTAILQHSRQFLLPFSPQRLAFCLPQRGEVDLRPLMQNLYVLNWQLAVPAVTARNAALEFRPWQPEASLTVDLLNIPTTHAPPWQEPPDILFIPLLAYDAAGYRLGYGGGYFDRTLAHLSPRPLAIGIAYAAAQEDCIWRQAHDEALAAVITEAGILKF